MATKIIKKFFRYLQKNWAGGFAKFSKIKSNKLWLAKTFDHSKPVVGRKEKLFEDLSKSSQIRKSKYITQKLHEYPVGPATLACEKYLKLTTTKLNTELNNLKISPKKLNYLLMIRRTFYAKTIYLSKNMKI